MALGTSLLSPFGDMVGESSAFDEFGLALRQVTSVTMQSDTDESEKLPASLIDGRGFPYKVFVVAFPAKTKVVNWNWSRATPTENRTASLLPSHPLFSQRQDVHRCDRYLWPMHIDS